jgi:hypothetical protein
VAPVVILVAGASSLLRPFHHQTLETFLGQAAQRRRALVSGLSLTGPDGLRKQLTHASQQEAPLAVALDDRWARNREHGSLQRVVHATANQ